MDMYALMLFWVVIKVPFANGAGKNMNYKKNAAILNLVTCEQSKYVLLCFNLMEILFLREIYIFFKRAPTKLIVVNQKQDFLILYISVRC